MKRFARSLSIFLFAAVCVASLFAQTYQKAPKVISDVLSVPPTPSFSLAPTRDRYVLVQGVRYPAIADLAQPMLRLGGLRINPLTNGPYNPTRNTGYVVRTIGKGGEVKIPAPTNGSLGPPIWSPDGREFAFTNTTANGVELWIAHAVKGTATKVPGVQLNTAYGPAARWLPHGDLLLCQIVPKNRGKAPARSLVPSGPEVQDASGKAAPVRTYQDLLKNADDVKAFDYYMTSQLALVKLDEGKQEEEEEEEGGPRIPPGVHPIGKPGIFESVQVSPNRDHLLVERTVKPYSFVLPSDGFAKKVEVWELLTGKLEYTLASLPTEEGVPIEGVPVGPRSYHWRPTAPAMLVWVEARDGGNPRTKVAIRDEVLSLSYPFKEQPASVAKLQFRFGGITWSQRAGLCLLSEIDRDRLWKKTWLLNTDAKDEEPRLVWDKSVNDRYGDPGSPLMVPLLNGQSVMLQYQKYIFLSGIGASPKGDRPFLDRLDLTNLKSERIWQCEDGAYETVVGSVRDDVSMFVTRYESPTEPPNYCLRTVSPLQSDGNAAPFKDSERVRLTSFPDPAPFFRGVKKQLVTYKRADGVDLSFTLYLPPGYKEGERLPAVFYAYPQEFTDAGTAGQVSGSPYRFTAPGGFSDLFFLTQGYAVLYNVTIPIVGDPQTVNNTFIEQLVSSAKAAIDKADEMGVIDPKRVGVTGHSYGAFMTANLLAHCDLFKAGIARSGAYNRTLTPFGFQSERRTIWQAPDMYMKVSPFMFADKIKSPILFIHGANDDNPGTFPVQSERMFQAVKGNGGTARLCLLPYEAHNYVARESVEHVLWEMIGWFNKYVKGG
jgi:dipeptidyl aminopeptidase/acylaminoacyl peptidase